MHHSSEIPLYDLFRQWEEEGGWPEAIDLDLPPEEDDLPFGPGEGEYSPAN